MSSEVSQRKLTSILAADVVGYSRLMAADEEGTVRRLRAYREILDGLIVSHHGRVFGTAGDSVIAEFASPVEAVRCAIEMQRQLDYCNAELIEGRRMRFRIGINLGDVVVEDENLLGDGVNIAARLEALAEPGGICVSAAVREQVEGKLALTYDDLGEQSVKNIPKPVLVYRVDAAPGAGGRAPSSSMSRKTASLAVALLALTGAVAAIWLLRPGSAPRVSAIAILPFVDMSPEGDQQYFAEGMAEELTHSLANVDGLRVAARTSAFAFKGKQEDVRTIGRQLGVGAVLEGSVRKAGDRLRIAVQLIAVADGFHLWSETFDRNLADVFEVQDAISREIVRVLKVQFHAEDHERVVARRTADLRAYELYLLARFFSNKRSENGLRKAVEYFRQALTADPDFASAWAGLAEAYAILWTYRYDGRQEVLAHAKEAALRALDIDEAIAEAHASLGHVRTLERDWEGAGSSYQRAIQLDAGYATAHRWYAELLAMQGRIEEGLSEARTSVELEPLSPASNAVAGFLSLHGRNYAVAIRFLKRALELSPTYDWARMSLVHAYLQAGMSQEAVDEYLRLEFPTSVRKMLLTEYQRGGRDAFLRGIVDLAAGAIQDPCTDRPYYGAIIHAYLGDEDQVFACLTKAGESSEYGTAYMRSDPVFDNIRTDPRFEDTLRRIGLDNVGEPG